MSSRVGTCFYMSPEVLAGEYNEKCDVWSLGVILYVVISGRAPFNGRDDNDTMKKIVEGKFEFKWEGWKNISSQCKDLICKMITESHKRVIAQDILDNDWVAKLAPESLNEKIQIDMDNICKFAGQNKLNKAVSEYIAFRLKEDDVKDLIAIFKKIDVNGDGTISFAELKEGLKTINKVKNMNLKEEDLKELFSKIDLDDSGTINYTEFIAATMNQKLGKTKEQFYQAFKTFDGDKDGKLSYEEICQIIQPKTPEDIQYIKKLIKDADRNGDGQIDFEEFEKTLV